MACSSEAIIKGIQTPDVQTQTSTPSYQLPIAEESGVVEFESEESFKEAFADKNSRIAKMKFKLPKFYLKPTKLPTDLKFKVIQLDQSGVIWRYTTKEGSEVWVSTVHHLGIKSTSLAEIVKYHNPTQFQNFRSIEIKGKEYYFLDAIYVELGFSLICFLQDDTLVIVMISGYNFSPEQVERYCNIEKVAVENIAQSDMK